MNKTKRLATSSMLIVGYVLLSRFFSLVIPLFGFPSLKVGFETIPVVIGSLLFGPLYGLLIGGIGDLIAAFLFPFGAFFPGFTLTYIIVGVLPSLLISLFNYFKIKDKFLALITIIILLILLVISEQYIWTLNSIKDLIITDSMKIMVSIALFFGFFLLIGFIIYFLRKGKNEYYSGIRILFVTITIQILCFIIMNSIWIEITGNIPFIFSAVARVLKSFLMIPILTILTLLIIHSLKKLHLLRGPQHDSTISSD